MYLVDAESEVQIIGEAVRDDRLATPVVRRLGHGVASKAYAK
jgi:hypothetical protein